METSSVTRSATSQLISSLGAGSGVNMAELASNLADAQFAGRIDRLATRSETLDRQISAASDLKSMMLGLAASLGERVRVGDLAPQPQVANAAVASAAYSGNGQPSGTYSLEVTALATGQTLASPAFASSAASVGSGTLTLRFGTIAGAGFTEDTAHAPVALTIAAGATLADVASAINGASAGVTAYVANTTTGAKLVLKGPEGAAGGFVLDAAEAPGDPGLAALAWTPAGDPARLLAPAGDAAFSIDGLAMSSPTNKVINPVPGVTLTLKATNIAAPTTLNFADNRPAITSAMQDLTGALNEIAAALRSATDPQSGDLARDSGARSLRSDLTRLAGRVIMPAAAADTPRTLADLGLSTQRDGSFKFDAARLTATLAADPEAAAAMFTNGLHGIYATVDSISRRASSISDPGALGGSLNRYQVMKRAVTRDQAKLSDQQEEVRARMVARFAVTDSRVGASRATLSFLQNQIDAWNSQGN